MARLTLVSTPLAAMTARAAQLHGALAPLLPHEPNVLVVANNAPIPEIVAPIHRTAAGKWLAQAWDRVVDLNAELFPCHPAAWRVADDAAPTLARAWRRAWGLGDGPLHLVIEGLGMPPGATLAKVFADARLTVLAEGLTGYGPTRCPVPAQVGERIETLAYLELIPALRPVLLSEHAVQLTPVPLT
ncbi:MAG: hypothetical protein LBJ08_00045, partial [Bifidobacteriaceae bacterium]|nr:hypothetical protein [Bifidobacteriaceae bacterium]